MPIVIDYSPVGAVADAAGQIGAQRQSNDAAQLFQQSQQANMNQQARMAQLGQQAQEARDAQGFRYDQLGEQQREFDANQADRQQQLAAQQPEAYTDEETGQTFQFTPQQKSAYENLKQTAAPDSEDFKAGVAKITGMPAPQEPRQQYNLVGPDGTSYTVDLTPKELISASAAGYKQLNDQAKTTIAQQNADTRTQAQKDAAASRAATLTQRAQLNSDNINAAMDRVNARLEAQFDLATKKETTETGKLRLKQARDAAADETAVAKAQLAAATDELNTYTKATPMADDSDPGFKQRHDAVIAAHTHMIEVTKKHEEAAARGEAAQNTPAGVASAQAATPAQSQTSSSAQPQASGAPVAGVPDSYVAAARAYGEGKGNSFTLEKEREKLPEDQQKLLFESTNPPWLAPLNETTGDKPERVARYGVIPGAAPGHVLYEMSNGTYRDQDGRGFAASYVKDHVQRAQWNSPGVGDRAFGSIVTKTGDMGGRRVFELANGQVVDEKGSPVQ